MPSTVARGYGNDCRATGGRRTGTTASTGRVLSRAASTWATRAPTRSSTRGLRIKKTGTTASTGRVLSRAASTWATRAPTRSSTRGLRIKKTGRTAST
jgi:hypothetical protein